MKAINILKSVVTMMTCAMTAMGICSCDNNDPDNLYGKHKDMKIVNNDLMAINIVYANKIEGGGFNVIGGKGDNYKVEVLDEDVLTAEIYQRGVGHSDPLEWTQPIAVSLFPKKLGETTVVVIDTDTDQIESVRVKVVNRYAALTVSESSVEDIVDGMQLWLMNEGENGTNDYHFVRQKYHEFSASETGEYHFEIHENDRSYFYLTLKDPEKETTWIVTDADNNREGYKWYEPDVVRGIKLHKHVLTKRTETPAYPKLFLFTDIADPERSFKTGPAETINYRFE